jgi:hypothetical protein
MKDGNYFSPTKTEFITFILVILGMVAAVIYSACIIPGFCKDDKPERHKDAELLDYLKHIKVEDISNIDLSLYSSSCLTSSVYNAHLEIQKKFEIVDKTNIKEFVMSLHDLDHFHPDRQFRFIYVAINIALANENFINFKIQRDYPIGDMAFIGMRASPEIEKLAGYRLTKVSFMFKSKKLFTWIKNYINDNKINIKCCECQSESGYMEHREKEKNEEDIPCFPCIM